MADTTEKKGYVKGSLKQVPFPKALTFVHKANKTGVLAIARDKRKVHIHFLNGEIVYVTSSYFPGLSLGDFLLKEGKISLQIHEESLEKIRGTQVKQGTYLVEKGYLSPHDLIETLNRQVLEKLFWLFEWEEGDFYFKEGPIIDDEYRLVKIEFQKLIYQGVRDYLPLDSLPIEFKGRKESILFRAPQVPFRLDTLGLGPIDTRILSFVNGQYTLRQIVALARLKKRAIYKILYGLFLSDVICFPEGLASAKKTQEIQKRKADAKKSQKGPDEGYEIRIADDLIKQAVSSVDRIRKEVRENQEEQVEFETPSPPAHAAEPTAEQELGQKLGERIREEVAPVGYDEDIAQQFGFDESSLDGFATQVDDDGSDQITHGVGDSFETAVETKTEPEEYEGQAGDYGFEADDYEDEPSPLGEGEDEAESFDINLDDFSDPDEIKRQGIMLLEEGRFDDAELFLQRSLELIPDDSTVNAYLGWAMYNNRNYDRDNFQVAESQIKQGMGPGKSRYQHFLYLGKIYAEEGQYEFAELHFIKALEMNVDCAEARESIKQIHSK